MFNDQLRYNVEGDLQDVKPESGSETAAIEPTELESQNEVENDAVAVDTREDIKPESASELTVIESAELPNNIHVVEKESNATAPKPGKAVSGALETVEIVDKKRALFPNGPATPKSTLLKLQHS
ncbi:hypothetical protein ACOME3_000518 [Neoechinorhynchus agilis]